MLAHPDLIAGLGRPCTELMTANPGKLVAKVGAEGVYAALLVEQGLGVALKIEDGQNRAAPLALAAILNDLGLTRPDNLVAWPVVNSRGETVGRLAVSGGLTQ